MRMLGVFEKSERVRHIGHLDIQRAVQRGLRRSGLPVAYSNGFNPHILVAFASALSTGAAGLREIMDVRMEREVSEETFLARMNSAMPQEMQLKQARAVDDRHPAMTASLRAGMYEIILRDEEQAEKLVPRIGSMMQQTEIQVPRKTKSGIRDVDMKPLIYALRGEGQKIYATLMLTERESCKPAMIIEGLRRCAGLPEEEEIRTLVIRTQLLGENAEGILMPLEDL